MTTSDAPPAVNGIPLQEAAVQLGVKPQALRMRIKRGSIQGYKGDDGRLYALMDKATAAGVTAQASSQVGVQQTSPNGAREGEREPAHAPADNGSRELIAQLRSEVAFLRGEVEVRRDAERELRVLIARLEERPTPALAEGQREELNLVKATVRQLPANLLSALLTPVLIAAVTFLVVGPAGYAVAAIARGGEFTSTAAVLIGAVAGGLASATGALVGASQARRRVVDVVDGGHF